MISVFNWQGQPSQILDNFGRNKSIHQIKKDAQRVNKYSDNARNFGEAASDKTAALIGRRNSSRSQ
jgi:hypothetical protein